MYTAILLILVAAGLGLVVLGGRKRKVLPAAAGAGVLLATAGVFGSLNFLAEMYWFEAVGFSGRFWTEVWAKVGLTLLGAVAGAVVTSGLLAGLWRRRTLLAVGAAAVGAFAGGNWGYAHWETILLAVNAQFAGVTEPVFGLDVGFYLFVLPLLDGLVELGLMLSAIALLAAGGSIALAYASDSRGNGPVVFRRGQTDGGAAGAVYLPAAALLVLLAAGRFFARYHLLYSPWGAVTGAGWTDLHVRLPAYWVMAVFLLVLAAVLLIGPLRGRLLGGFLRARMHELNLPPHLEPLATTGFAAAAAAAAWVLVVGLLPAAVQWLRVEPNEISFERPYIARNIEFTRRAFNLHTAEEHEFAATEQFDRQVVEDNPRVFENIRLWDWRALDAVYRQFQEIRLYYQFLDVDVDRYHVDGDYRQVMVSARELELENLPAQSQTFVNRHFKYTHGYGITLANVSEFTPEGLPNLLIKDIPPVWSHASLEVRRPEIYYGEATSDYVVVNSSEEEFDYPRGQKNVYTRYEGTGGVEMGSLWRRFVYGWHLGGTRLLLSGYPRAGSRIQYRREVRPRIRAVAPFLHLDQDPYIVLAEGRLYWICDAYTSSRHYPYSEPLEAASVGAAGAAADFLGKNYLRNSVKAVVDAYNGEVALYVFDEDDPILRTWRRIFPGLFRDRGQMPPALQRHIRYPASYLLAQGLVHAKYHMKDPDVFYNQEDLWVRATEKYYQNVRPVQPYYIMWEAAGSDEPEFIIMLPFTPKKRQVLIGWIAGMCDGENYGRFLSYTFPKERRLLGPQQVETKIDQDPDLSSQLTLWDQRGSSVIRGNVLAIPVGGTLMYVEPIYLRAQTAAYPELRLVVVMHDDRLSYGESFREALAGLVGEAPAKRPAEAPATGPAPTPEQRRALRPLIEQADAAFSAYLRATGEGRFDDASAALDRLQKALNGLRAAAESSGGDEEPPPPNPEG